MGVNELVKILEQVHEPDEYQLVAHDLDHEVYYIWKLENGKMKDLNLNLREFRKEHARFDIFINGQYILERDYVTDHSGKDFLVKFKKFSGIICPYAHTIARSAFDSFKNSYSS